MLPATKQSSLKFLALALFYISACGIIACDEPFTEPTISLLPESALASSCYDWPNTPFSRDNNTGGLRTSVVVGDTAIDFTLMDIDSTKYSLSLLLQTKPVLMVFGSYT
jgi:hypothetical protein